MVGMVASVTKGLSFIILLRINKVPFVPDIHTVLFAFEVIGPDCRLDEGSGSIVAKIIDSESEFPEIDTGFRIELIQPHLGNSSCQHVSDIPPGEDQCWETKSN